MHFAKMDKERPGETIGLWRAFVIANSVQFPRALLIVALVNTDLAAFAGLADGGDDALRHRARRVLRRWPHKHTTAPAMAPGNPFRLIPALHSAPCSPRSCSSAKRLARSSARLVQATSLLGGLVDVSTVMPPPPTL